MTGGHKYALSCMHGRSSSVPSGEEGITSNQEGSEKTARQREVVEMRPGGSS